MIIYLVENVSQKPRNSLMRGRVRCMLRYQVTRLFRCKFRKKMQEKQEECEISPNNGRQKALFRRLR